MIRHEIDWITVLAHIRAARAAIEGIDYGIDDTLEEYLSPAAAELGKALAYASSKAIECRKKED
jgi:hypothetical protein